MRDTKRRARRDLHREAQVPVLYLVEGELPQLVGARVHTKFGALAGADAPTYGASSQEAQPKIRFLRCDLAPVRNAVISVAAGEAYRIGMVEPPDDEFVYAHVSRLSAAECANLPIPDDD
jgi:hypothetical protein